MSRVWVVARAFFSRRWWLATLVVLVGMALLARLGVWQLDRLAQRRAANAELVLALAQSPVQLTGEPITEPLDSLKDRQAVATGVFDFEQQVYIKLQNWQGQPGGYLVAPLVITGTNTAVLVNRGWIPNAEADPTNWAKYDQPGPVTVQGAIALPETLDGATPPAEPQKEWYRADVAGIARQLPYITLPFYVLQAPEGTNSTLPYRLEPEIDLSEGSHLGYAIQWFLFTVTLAVIYVVYVHKNTP